MFVLVRAHLTIGGLAGFVVCLQPELQSKLSSVCFSCEDYVSSRLSKTKKQTVHVVKKQSSSLVCPFFVTFSCSLDLRIVFSEHRAHWDACNGISSWKMLSLHKTLPYCRHCKSPHTQRKFKYLFIFRANKTYSQLQNCPVQTRQRRHIQCKSFPLLARGFTLLWVWMLHYHRGFN